VPLLTLYFQLHQPFRLHPDGTTLFWDEKNEEIFVRRAQRCYVPTIRMFSDLVHAHYDFKLSLGVSGTFLEQAELYHPDVIDALRGLLDVGRDTRQVEFLEQPYYYSFASFFADPCKTEFKEQVSLHRQRMNDVFGVKPSAFANTAISYSNEIANIVADMGFKAILCEPGEKTLNVRDRQPIGANVVYRAIGRKGRPRKLAVLPRDRTLSRRIMSAFDAGPSMAHQCAEVIHEAGGEVAVLVSDFPLVEKDTPGYEKMVAFWKVLAEEVTSRNDIVPANPTEIAEWFQITECPMVDCPHPANSFLAKVASDTPASHAQGVLFRNIESPAATWCADFDI
jgi:alpha-amylase